MDLEKDDAGSEETSIGSFPGSDRAGNPTWAEWEVVDVKEGISLLGNDTEDTADSESNTDSAGLGKKNNSEDGWIEDNRTVSQYLNHSRVIWDGDNVPQRS